MAIDLSKLATAYDFTLTTKGFGKVKIKSLTVGHLMDLEKLLIDSDIDGVNFSRELLLLLGCKQTTSNAENPLEHTKEIFSRADLALIDDEDVEIFAQEFLAHNGWILSACHKVGDEIDSSEKIERNLEEKSSAYLLRGFKIYFENEKLRLEKITGPISNYFKGVKDNYKATDLMTSLLSKNLYRNTTIDLLKSNLNLSDRLQESILGFNKSAMSHGKLSHLETQRPFDTIKLPENPIHETNKRLNTVISAIESMKPLVSDSAELIRSMNDTAIQMQADFIKNARGNQLYTKWAMAIAVLSLLVTSWFSWLGYKESIEQGEKAEKKVKAYQQDMLKQNKKFENILRILTFNVERDAKRQVEHNELLQILKENAKNKSK